MIQDKTLMFFTVVSASLHLIFILLFQANDPIFFSRPWSWKHIKTRPHFSQNPHKNILFVETLEKEDLSPVCIPEKTGKGTSGKPVAPQREKIQLTDHIILPVFTPGFSKPSSTTVLTPPSPLPLSYLHAPQPTIFQGTKTRAILDSAHAFISCPVQFSGFEFNCCTDGLQAIYARIFTNREGTVIAVVFSPPPVSLTALKGLERFIHASRFKVNDTDTSFDIAFSIKETP